MSGLATKMAPHAPRTYLERLPKTLQAELARGGRPGSKTTTPPPPALQEALAREVLTCGIMPKGEPLAYVVRRLRHGLGLCGYPSAPTMPVAELAFLDGKVAEVLDRLGIVKAGHSA